MLTALLVERLLLLITLGGAAIVWLSKNNWAWPLISKALRWTSKQLPGYKTSVMLLEMRAILKPNGRSSIPDSLARIEVHQLEIAYEVKRTIRRMRLHDDRDGLITFTTDEFGKCISASEAYCNLVGLTQEEVLTDGWKNIFIDSERTSVYAEWESSIRECRDFHIVCTYRNNKTLCKYSVRVDAYVARFCKHAAGWIGQVTILNQKCDTASS